MNHSLYSTAWDLCFFGNRMLGEALGIEFNDPHPLYCRTFTPFSCILIGLHVVVEECYLLGVTKLVATARVAHDFCRSSVMPKPSKNHCCYRTLSLSQYCRARISFIPDGCSVLMYRLKCSNFGKWFPMPNHVCLSNVPLPVNATQHKQVGNNYQNSFAYRT